MPAILCFMARALDDMNIHRDGAIASELAIHAAVEFQIAHLSGVRKMVIYWSRGPVPFFGKPIMGKKASAVYTRDDL